MSLQALGADNETIIYLSADGDGTEVIPFKSIFLAEQYNDWSVTILNPSIAVTGTFYLDIQPVSQSGEWTVSLSQNTIAALNTVNVNLDQPLTLTQLEALTVKVEEQQPLDLQALDSLDNKLPAGLTVEVDRLKVDNGIVLPSTYNVEAVTLPLPSGASTEAKQIEAITKLTNIDSSADGINIKLPQLSLQGDSLKVDIEDYSNLVTALEAATLKANINNTVSVISDVVLDVSPVVEIIEETNSAIETINTDNTAKQNEIITKLEDISTQLGAGLATTVDNLPSVQPVSQSGTWTVGLPSGASTAANQTLILNAVTALDTKLTNDTIKVDGSAHTQPVNGTVAVSNHPNTLTDTQLRAAPVNVTVQDLANILASTTLQAEVNNNVSVVGSLDFDGIATESQQLALVSLLTQLKDYIEDGVDVTTELTQPLTNTQLRSQAVESNIINYTDLITALQTITIQSEVINTVPVITDNNVDLEPIVLEQQASNVLLEAIDLKLDVNNNNLLTDAQLRATPLSVEGEFYQSVQPISVASLPLPDGLTLNSDRLLVDGSTVTQPISGSVTADTGLIQPLTDTELRATSVNVTVDNPTIAATQSGDWTIGLPVDAATASNQQTANTTLNAIDSKLPTGLTTASSRLIVDGSGVTQPISGTVDTGLTQPLTDTQLRAVAVEVAGLVDARIRVGDSIASQTNPVPVGIPAELITLFSRLRVAEERTIVSIRQDNRLRDLILTEGQVSGTGTSSNYIEAEASTILTVSGTTGLRRLRSRTAGLYNAGNSLLCFFTFNFEGAGEVGVFKRSGYFDNRDGIFIEEENDVLSFVLRSSVSGSVVETKIPSANWNGDKFDGTGQGYNFDRSKCHIGWIALEWLGVGDIYCGFVYDARPVLAHVFRNPNLNAKPYMRTANLFLNYEIERTIAGSLSHSLRTTCAVLKSEGALNESGANQIITLGASRATANANTLYPLITFRLQPNYINARVLIESFEATINDNANTTAQFLLVKNPVIAGYTFNGTSLPNSAIEYQNNLAPIITTTFTISSYEQLIMSKSTTITSNSFLSGTANSSPINFLGSNFNNTPDLYALAVISTTASNTIPAATVYLWEQL